ncbi:MAG: RagB/SusD family nutrient uptake outer membrane protein [Segetibacter sp.]
MATRPGWMIFLLLTLLLLIQGFNGQWSYDYEGISRSNLSISYLTDPAIITKTGIDESQKNTLLGQVYFLRAFYYFDLVNNFGSVPMLLKPLQSFAEAYSIAKRETKEKVWEQISSDLTQAVSLLPDSKYADAAEKWRASKGAALALQAKVALYNQKWEEVISKVTELEGLNFYSLDA